MSGTILTDKTISAVTRRILDMVSCSCSGKLDPVLIITPDRATLRAEQMLLSETKCLLNVRVVTFSMLFNIIRDELGATTSSTILDKTSAVLFMWRAIKNVREKLIWFRTSTHHYALAEKMFNTINQLTSSMIDFEKLERGTSSEITRKKMHDIALIYAEYKQLIANYTDSSGMLGYLINNIKHSQLIKDAKVYITGFDYISIQRLAVLSELIRNTKNFTAGAREGSEFISTLAELFSSYSITPEKITHDAPRILNPKNKTQSNITIKSFPTPHLESAWVANKIQQLVQTKNIHFRDIVVTLCDFENTATVFASTFVANGIAVNVDIGEKLNNHPLTLFIRDSIILALDQSTPAIINVIKNVYSDFSQIEEFALENFILKYNMNLRDLPKAPFDFADEQTNTAINKFNETIAKAAKKLIKAKNYNDICITIKTILQNITITDIDEVWFARESTARESLIKVTDTITQTLGSEPVNLRDFLNMFESITHATKISIVPTYADSVMLVDTAEYEPTPTRYLFVCGANSGAFPIEQADTDIINEHDIANCQQVIQPTASLQNLRAAHSAVNVLNCAQSELFISTTEIDASNEPTRRSRIIDQILRRTTATFNPNSDEIFTKNYAMDIVASSVASGEAFREPVLYRSILDSLNINNTQIATFNFQSKIKQGGELLLPNNRARVTQLEGFYACPYSHFLTHGLCVRPRERQKMAGSMAGLLIHNVVELLLNEYIKTGCENFDTDLQTTRAFEQTLLSRDFAYFATRPENKPIIATLRREIKKISDGIIAAIRKSKYTPIATEKLFEHTLDGILIRGIADRIDCAEIDGKKHAIVIDYKTGSNVRFSYKDLYLGTRLQLPLYMGFLSKEFIPTGAYYMALSSGYETESKTPKLAGLATNWVDIDGTPRKNVSTPELNSVIAYGKAISQSAIKHISDGFIKPTPLNESACRYCPAANICINKQCVRADTFDARLSAASFLNLKEEGAK
jgi:ATP-dependent helicase/nuclease subunit B